MNTSSYEIVLDQKWLPNPIILVFDLAIQREQWIFRSTKFVLWIHEWVINIMIQKFICHNVCETRGVSCTFYFMSHAIKQLTTKMILTVSSKRPLIYGCTFWRILHSGLRSKMGVTIWHKKKKIILKCGLIDIKGILRSDSIVNTWSL